MRTSAVIALMIWWSACDYSADVRDCRVACSSSSGCPSGLSCATSEGLCRVTGASQRCADTVGDAGLDGAVTVPRFASQVDFTTGTDPQIVAIGDLNGDGRPDLAVVNYVSTTVSVFLNTTATGATIPSFTARFDFPTGSGPRFVATGDFNGDGKLDLAVANQIATTIAVFLNTTATGATTPSFAAEVEFTTGSGVPSVAVADINSDGKPDLVVSNSHSGTVTILLNTTATGATAPSFASKVDLTVGAQDSGLDVAIGDVNLDGRPDIVITDYGARTVSVFLNTTATNATTPSFAAKSGSPTGPGPAALAVGDLNDDGKPDLAVANHDAPTVSVLLDTTATGAAIPSFDAEAEFTTGAGNPSIAIGDLNGDGKPDLAVTSSGAAGVAVLVNTTATGAAAPSFTVGVDFTIGPQPGSIAIDDFNGDGKPDLAVVISSNAVSILLAQ